MAQLEATLDTPLRETIAYAFRELLLNAIEWGGRLDPNRTVRIACLRSKRMLMYRIADPGQGFNIEDLPHAAIGQSTRRRRSRTCAYARRRDFAQVDSAY